jgi:dTDP-4-dehydrorhamnose reductase
MRFLLLGGTGQVGEEIRALAAREKLDLAAPTRDQVDLENAAAVAKLIGGEPWRAVINAAAYTEVDRAESEEAAAFAANADAPARLAQETARCGIPLIHISTDYVFDGRKGAPYVETDDVAPINAYGRSKLAGERGVSAANPRHVILRTSCVYSPFRKNFVKTILRLAGERDHLRIVSDQRGCPTAAIDIAKACLVVATGCASAPDTAPYSTYHFAGGGDATWFDFASAIVELADLRKRPRIEPIRTVDYPTAALRAPDTRLDSSKILNAYGVEMRPWREALEKTIDRLQTQKGLA